MPRTRNLEHVDGACCVCVTEEGRALLVCVRVLLALLALQSLLVLVACSSAGSSPEESGDSFSVSQAPGAAGHGSAPPGAFVRECGTDVWGDLGARKRWLPRSILVGPFAFVWIRDAARAPGRTRAYQARQVAFKILALIKRGHEATVTVPASERSHVALSYDPSKWSEYPTVANGERMVTFRACEREGAGSSSWRGATQFNGAINVPRPHCVLLDVRVGERGPIRHIKAAFGKGACRRRA
jgi:hypothetical protein